MRIGCVGAGPRRGRHAQDRADVGQACRPVRAREEAVVPDAVEAARQDMEQEASDELRGRQGHDPRPPGLVAPVVLDAEADAVPTQARMRRLEIPIG